MVGVQDGWAKTAPADDGLEQQFQKETRAGRLWLGVVGGRTQRSPAVARSPAQCTPVREGCVWIRGDRSPGSTGPGARAHVGNPD